MYRRGIVLGWLQHGQNLVLRACAGGLIDCLTVFEHDQRGDGHDLETVCQLMTIPTLMVIKQGQVVKQSIGAMPKAQILAML